ncbi:unnamed protein product, partial [Laminaria digitata]
QIHCRNRHGSNRRGKKVTGLAFVETARLRHSGRRHHLPCREGAGGASAAAAATKPAGPAITKLPGGAASSMSAQYSLLATTNDSRLRIYDLDNFAMTCKFKGLANNGIQMKASFSQDSAFVISGSEDGQVKARP